MIGLEVDPDTCVVAVAERVARARVRILAGRRADVGKVLRLVVQQIRSTDIEFEPVGRLEADLEVQVELRTHAVRRVQLIVQAGLADPRAGRRTPPTIVSIVILPEYRTGLPNLESSGKGSIIVLTLVLA